MKKFVVTGALGHIGSRLIRELANWFPGSEIIMIDNMSAQRYCSLFNLPKTSKYLFIEADVSKINLAEIIDGANAVFHLAAITNAAGSFEIASEIEENNYICTKKVAKNCLEKKTPLIYLSSTSVYGTSEKSIDENCTSEELKPQSPYAETKLKEEKLIQDLNSKGLDSILLRFGTIFGKSPGMRFHTAVNKFCWQASIGQPLSVWKTAYHQLRPYLDLTDAMGAFKIILEESIFDGEIYNVLTGNYSVERITQEITKVIPDVKIEFVDSKIMNQLSYEVLDIKFKQKGFDVNGDISKGIKETLDLLTL